MSKTIHLVLFGVGNVGSTLIKQLQTTEQKLIDEQEITLKLPVIVNSRLALFREDGVTDTWKSDFTHFSAPYKVEEIIDYVHQKGFEHLIAIDATADADFVQHYLPLIENGFNLVSANKHANTAPLAFYDELREALYVHNKQYLYETNVGAGLPIIETIQNLFRSGENIRKIRGVFSGSLSYIFNTYSAKDIAFSEVLKEAAQLGYTEPDAREDLSGNDVARKLLILARELGVKKELNEVQIASLVPQDLIRKTSLRQFEQRISELNPILDRQKQASKENEVLRYVGELDLIDQRLEVKLIHAPKQSSLGQLKAADSLIEVYSDSYGDQPMVIQGAGAGAEVTARGVLSDILKISNHLNHVHYEPA